LIQGDIAGIDGFLMPGKANLSYYKKLHEKLALLSQRVDSRIKALEERQDSAVEGDTVREDGVGSKADERAKDQRPKVSISTGGQARRIRTNTAGK